MVIKTKIVIDLTGPQGNVSNILTIARYLAIKYDMDIDAIIAEMQSADYEHLLEVFEFAFGDYVMMYR